jgi:hypothetical protein
MIRNLALALVFALCISIHANARVVPDWPYEKLMAKSDLVVIAEFMKNRDTPFDFAKDKDFAPWFCDPVAGPIIRGKLAAQITTLKSLGTLKGKAKDEYIEVIHYRWTEHVPIENGPGFIEFPLCCTVTMETKDEEGRTSSYRTDKLYFLLFLRMREDGLYEATSGQMDPDLSVRLVTLP